MSPLLRSLVLFVLMVGSACGADECDVNADCPSREICKKGPPGTPRYCANPCGTCPEGTYCRYDGIDGGEYYCGR